MKGRNIEEDFIKADELRKKGISLGNKYTSIEIMDLVEKSNNDIYTAICYALEAGFVIGYEAGIKVSNLSC